MVENPRVELAELGRRLDAEFVDEQRTGTRVDAQRLGLASRPVQREHLESAQVLAERMVGGERIEVSDDLDVLAEPEPCLVEQRLRLEAQFGQPGDRGSQRVAVTEARVRGPAPRGQCIPQRRRRCRRIGRNGPAGGLDGLLEPLGVDRDGVGIEDVATRRGTQRELVAERATQVRHVDLDGLARRRRRVVAPQPVDQGVPRHHGAGTSDEERQQQGRLRASHIDGSATETNGERSQHLDARHLAVVRRHLSTGSRCRAVQVGEVRCRHRGPFSRWVGSALETVVGVGKGSVFPGVAHR